MASYRVRATAIYTLVADLRRTLEQQIDAGPADKAALIDVSVEIVNKLLYCFLLSQELFDRIDELLNDHLQVEATPHAISMLYLRVLGVTRQVERCAHQWVVKYQS
jgi:hypothetical protein